MPGTLTVGTLSDGTNSTSATNAIQGSAKAWSQFSMSGTTITNNRNLNISSITLSATGFFSVSFTSSLAAASYGVVGSSSVNQASSNWPTVAIFTQTSSPYYSAPTTSSFGFSTQIIGSGAANIFYATIAVFY